MSTPPITPQFDVDSARKAGYSDDEILQHLTSTRAFDTQGALKSGYSKQDMINYLSTTSPPSVKPPITSSALENTLSNAQISPPETGIVAMLDRAKNKVRDFMGAGSKPAGDILGGPVLGPMNIAQGVARSPMHPVQGANQVISGIGQTAALPSAVVFPGTMAYAAPGIIAQSAVQKGSQAVGVPKDYAELLGNIAGIAATGKTIKALKVKPEVTTKTAAQTLTNAINPTATEMPKFQGSLENQLPNILEHAKLNNLPIRNKVELAQAIKSAADTKRAEFQGKLDSVKDQTVKLDDIPGYQGATVGGGKATVLGPAGKVPTMTSTPQFGQTLGRGGIATLGQLYSRLNDLNGELFNSYNKSSGRAANAAVRAHSDIAAEAAGVRNALYNGMGKALGMDPGDLADMNKAGGELGYLAEKTQLAADTERYMQNKANQGPMKVSLVNPLSRDFLPDTLANKLINKVRGNPADKSISTVLDALSKANAIPPDDAAAFARHLGMSSVQTNPTSPVAPSVSGAAPSAGESFIDEVTRGGPGSPPTSTPNPSQSYSRPGSPDQMNVTDMLKQALAKPGPASQQIKDILSGNADRQKIANASSFNSPADVAGFQQAAAQKLFGKDFATLSVTQKLLALKEATNLQNLKRGLYSNYAATNKR